ncbi:hypothetical protein [Mucilaginibacter sp. PAMB04168]|uniref:NADase-type glycan-binding domain-containing protein n=1 Tax=Mucilaginibacter sp. PAMB04168 TaxID=3138567 RepID=UPI0031F6FFE6
MKYTPPASAYSKTIRPAKPQFKTGNALPQPQKNNKAAGWIVFVIIVLIIINRPLGYVAVSVFLFLENALMFSKATPPALMWAILGVFAGLVCGSWVARKKFHLNMKITWVTLAILAIFIQVAVSVNKPVKAEAEVQTRESRLATPWVSVTSSEPLPAYLTYSYTADNLLDSLDDTAWMFRSSADTNYVSFVFNKEGADELPRLMLTGFKIKNGYNKTLFKWNSFNRIKNIVVLHNSNTVGELIASDLYGQEEDLSIDPVELQKGDTIQLIIKSVYTGKKNIINSTAVTRLVPVISYTKL